MSLYPIDPKEFQRLTTANHIPTSPVDPFYNCIGYAAGDDRRWWWPKLPGRAERPTRYWPENAPHAETVAAFVAAYSSVGYASCKDGTYEAGFEKIAIFINSKGVVKHAARQLDDKYWTSKMGGNEDIRHELKAVAGSKYGHPKAFLKRPKKNLLQT